MAAPLKVEFHFDFGSPNAYLAELALPEIEMRTGVKFDYVPVLLGGVYKATGNMSPGESLRGIKNKPEYNALETERFLRRHCGRFRGPVRALFPHGLSPHVVRAEEDGRSAGVPRGVPVLRRRYRSHCRPRPEGPGEEKADREYRQRRGARLVRLADLLCR